MHTTLLRFGETSIAKEEFYSVKNSYNILNADTESILVSRSTEKWNDLNVRFDI